MIRQLVLMVLAMMLSAAPVHAEQRYGALHVVRPAGPMRDFVILFSRADAWGAEDQRAAELLAAQGAFVAGVESGPYLARVAGQPCHLMDGDSESLSRQIQREEATVHYHTPILAGIGAGGLLAERVLALAPANSMAGAASLDPVGSPALDASPCGARASALEGFWTVGATPGWTGQAVVAASGVRPVLRQMPEGQAPAEALAALVAPHLAPAGGGGEDVSDLPLVELKAARPTDMLAIVLAGDGGWRDIDKRIGEDLQKAGVNVVGLDSLRYFWSAQTPDRTAADVARIMRSYMAKWGAKHVALIGYSFGADVLPFVYTRLPEGLRAQVSQMSLLALSKGADFEIRVVGWLGAGPSARALPVPPELARVPAAVVQCFYGADDAEGSACPGLAGTAADVVRTAGSHHFDGDYEALARRILQRWRQRIS
ncbi:MAG: virulence factor family protein [Rhodospirillales bacterium]|nr:virulence factor family protein [Rhodospirillales bacterium]